ncbi:MAG: glycerol-3-phosphate dehydrogenase [Rhizobiales bacterium]|nr:glycerol-3-phosphate dehydrogenase [Hyphomicrobiales bacterium]
MATILILGAGVMGSALAVPAADNGHRVLLAGTPLDDGIVARLKQPGGVHPKLDEPLPDTVEVLADAEVRPEHADAADLIIVGVSSPGIGWAAERLNALLTRRQPVAFVTKGLDRWDGTLATYAETLPPRVANIEAFIGIGGPCIARELANRYPTASIYASRDRAAAAFAAGLMQAPYYRLAVGDDVTGVEACAALKNFFAIGVSAMQTRHPDRARPDGQSKNPTAAAFNQAVREMAALCELLGGRREVAFDLAGIGDLHVTVGGGRNSRLGHFLGAGRVVSDVMKKELAGETVEGIDTARMLDTLATSEAGSATISRDRFPLAFAILDAVRTDRPLGFELA